MKDTEVQCRREWLESMRCGHQNRYTDIHCLWKRPWPETSCQPKDPLLLYGFLFLRLAPGSSNVLLLSLDILGEGAPNIHMLGTAHELLGK